MSDKNVTIKIDESKMRPVDVADIKADVGKLSALGWTRNYDINSTIREMLDYFRKETL